ncbi:poly-gamma-glutamate system protein [Caproicibacterium sp. BJN0003]|uniref:poly-gamma-glutamate system protein n=1 Tax=Caproicibacterium sp. BJN0003 TaxID=2994078 RepID=UPI002254C709|nr:poly-gamma-glutamate system protein [Caproicibacterium sp. BJN0003]UZT82515.1 poly-gamma-glutamate system protein [Caproicibacterium sp. BJN0003]
MKQRLTRREIPLVFLFLVLCLAVWWISASGQSVKTSDYEVRLAAARRMQACMDAVKNYKQERNIPLNPEDIFGTGMLGEEYNGITTTLGDLQAKRTTANSDMAALCVALLEKAGIKQGDTVGVGVSGSFPSMNLAVLCACEEMKVKALTIPSVGASTYGANNPELTFPAMLKLLTKDGLLTDNVLRVTLGGDSDCGLSMDPKLRNQVEQSLHNLGITLWKEPDFQKNLQERMALYEEHGPISCYIGVGGNMTSIGISGKKMVYGVTGPKTVLAPVTEKSGLLDLYHDKGLPVINLLDIKKLCTDYGLPFDPAALSEPGTSAIYYVTTYSVPAVIITLLLALVILILYWSGRKKR